MKKASVNCETGEVTVGDMTDAEVHEADWKPVNPVPESVDMRQAQLALLEAGLWQAVEALVAAELPAVQIAYRTTTTVRRSSSIVAYLAAKLPTPLTDAQVDALFIRASKIVLT